MNKIKKTLIIGICILILGFPGTTALFTPNMKNNITRFSTFNRSISTRVDPPNWATGNFSGEWGIGTFGIPTIPMGPVEGYYREGIFTGYIKGVFSEYNKAETGQIEAIIFGYYLIGVIQNEATGNGTYIVGLGGRNETTSEFYYNLHLFVGPGWYMIGTYTKF